ncbi:MAG TPA: hypothetical protein DCK85_06955 [Ktedonobacter sp.]|nr:hypothetical protein [Ktedonobacter sp.]HBE28686.1 hypothetical protein [Ktedonobacter sp.]
MSQGFIVSGTIPLLPIPAVPTRLPGQQMNGFSPGTQVQPHPRFVFPPDQEPPGPARAIPLPRDTTIPEAPLQ